MNLKSVWVTVIDDERGVLKFQFVGGLVFVHTEFKKKFSAMRAAKILFPECKRILKEAGYANMCVAIPDDDEKLHRFEKLFGFHDIGRSDGHILMEQSNG